MKKKLWVIVSLVSLVFLSFILYRSYFLKPTPIPSDKQHLMKEINNAFPEAQASSIQDMISIDDQHYFIPFISKDGKFGVSYWVWERSRWQPASINTTGQPFVWQINRDDPSSFHFVWNIDPRENLDQISFYLIRDRGYHIIDGDEHHYFPRVQMEQQVSLKEKDYGVLKLPKEWSVFMKTFKKVKSAEKQQLLFDSFFYDRYIYFGWIPYSKNGKEAFPESSVNGSRYSNGNESLDFLRILDKDEIEHP